jgi:hypothetical protein
LILPSWEQSDGKEVGRTKTRRECYLDRRNGTCVSSENPYLTRVSAALKGTRVQNRFVLHRKL